MQDETSVRADLHEQINNDPEGVIDIIVSLIKKVEQLTDRVSHLEGRLAKNSSNSSKPPSSDQKKKPNPKSRRKKGAKINGGQKGPKGGTLNQSETPDYVHDITLESCPLTGEKLDKSNIVNVIKRQVFELPKQVLDIHEYRIYQYLNSNGDIVSSESPEGVNSPVQYGKNFKHWLVYMNDYQLIPLNRIQTMSMDFFGLKVSEQIILNARHECYDDLSNFESELKNAVIKTSIVHADETGFRINGINNWLHVACSAWESLIAIGSSNMLSPLEL